MEGKKSLIRSPLSRRDFIKAGVATGITLATAGIVKLANPQTNDTALADPGLEPYYFGTDTSWATDTNSSLGLPQNFYIGKMGKGFLVYNDPNTTSFKQAAALKATSPKTFVYWGLKGPNWHIAGQNPDPDPFHFGYQQGTAALIAYFNTFLFKSIINGLTIFVDIEEEYDSQTRKIEACDGWLDYPVDPNPSDPNDPNYQHLALPADPHSYIPQKCQLVLNGFIQAIYDYEPTIIIPGVYTRSDLWQTWFGSYDTLHPIVAWLAGGSIACSPDNNAIPHCPSLNEIKLEAGSLFETKKYTGFGRNQFVIYQFRENVDYDISDQSGNYYFVPVRGGC